MNKYRETWKLVLQRALEEEGLDPADPRQIVAETPPRPELGDIAFPMFSYSRRLKKSPQEIAIRLERRLRERGAPLEAGSVAVQGPYLNVRLHRPSVTAEVLEAVRARGDLYGQDEAYRGRKIMVEFSCPNTNKPLHLGHLRNDAIGMSMARIMAARGAEVLKVNLINDRGVHICKSMLAYRRYGGGTTPEAAGIKGDHLVGNFYVRYAELAKQEPSVEEEVRRMLQAWESGDREVRELWRKMNGWTLEGIAETYRRTGAEFDRIYYESETYLLGREEVLKGLEQKIFSREKDGSVWADLTPYGLERKVLLRADGTSLYLTQDIGTAVQRHRDWPFDQLIYVVANEQRYHFQVLFKVLELLGHPWCGNLHHLAYGMVNLPEGKMKSREGTVVDADDLLAELQELALAEIKDKERELEVENLDETAAKIALGALHYYLLQASPYKDIIFNPRESISFTGDTGPYLQYNGARISSMLRKFGQREARYRGGRFLPQLLKAECEWEILKLMASYPDTVALAAEQYNPSLIAAHLYELAKLYSGYYHDVPVLQDPNADLVVSRIGLASFVLQVLKNGLRLIGVPFLEKM